MIYTRGDPRTFARDSCEHAELRASAYCFRLQASYRERGFLIGASNQRFCLRLDSGGDHFEEFCFFGAGQSAEFGAGLGGESYGEVNFLGCCRVEDRLDFLAGGRGEGLERAVAGLACLARVAVTKSDY